MSYKDYSEETVKEILLNIRQSSSKEYDTSLIDFTPEDTEIADRECGFDSSEIQIKDYVYNHPNIAQNNRVNDTHIIIEKWFESELSEEKIWKVIFTELKGYFGIENVSSEIKNLSSGKKWCHISHSNHETVFRLKKTGQFTSMKVVQRLGFCRPEVEGVLHGSYISLILFGITYMIFEPSLSVSIASLVLLWTLMALIIYRFSVSSRNKKLKRLTDFTDRLIGQIKSQ